MKRRLLFLRWVWMNRLDLQEQWEDEQWFEPLDDVQAVRLGNELRSLAYEHLHAKPGRITLR